MTSCEPLDFCELEGINFVEISDGKRIFEPAENKEQEESIE